MRLSFLRTYFKDLPQAVRDEEDEQPIFTFLEEVNRLLISLYHSLHDKQVTKSKTSDVFFMLLPKIFLFKAESTIVALPRSNASLFDLVTLRFWRTIVTHQLEENTPNDKLVFTRIFSVSKRVIWLYKPILDSRMREEMDFKMYHLVCNLFDEVMHVKADLRDTYHQFPRHNFPKTNVPGVVDFLLRKLMDILKYNPISIAPVKHQIQTIIGDLKFFRSFLRDVVEQDTENQQVQDLGARVINMVYEIELNVVGGMWYHFSYLDYLLEDTRLLKIQSREIYERKAADIIVPKVTQASQREISQSSVPQIDEIVVELNDQEQAILDRLTRGSLQRDLVAIVGMPGIGKTTMAKKVFNGPKISFHFHVRAWCHVSQVYNKRDLLLDILSSISMPTADTLQMGNADLELMLYHKLKQKRFLIVMDDMWNTGAWDDLEKSLPSDRNGSRILITSRLHDVALKAKPDSKPHSLCLLSDSESWDLLQCKIFHDQDCPAELSEIGMQISRSCGGLRLAIVAIAGVLERTDRTRDWWYRIAESMSSHIFDNPEMQCKVIVELSYKHLPDRLKPCFLYFGIFQEQKDILVRMLIWLWISEGFVQKSEQKSSEDLAEEYLMDLVGRNLEMVAKRRSSGGVKACHVHDILRDLCKSKLKEENFSRIIMKYEKPHASFDDLDYGVDFGYFDHLDSIRYDDYRLCAFTRRNHFVVSRPFGAHVRSLLFFGTNDMYPRCPYDVSFISNNFKLLRVLDLECTNMGTSFFSGVELLVHLRFSAISGDIDSVPSSISNLWNLETIIVKGLKGKVILPDTIWYMARLRHVHVNNHATFILEGTKLVELSQLYDLVTLSSPCFSDIDTNLVGEVDSRPKIACWI